MKDALQAAPGGGLDYYSYEPFQIYAAAAVPQMAWVSTVGDLWRSSNDIRHSWKSVLSNAFLTNKWAPNARPGHYNDADELEIGNGKLTVAEQRSHFALWCLMQGPGPNQQFVLFGGGKQSLHRTKSFRVGIRTGREFPTAEHTPLAVSAVHA